MFLIYRTSHGMYTCIGVLPGQLIILVVTVFTLSYNLQQENNSLCFVMILIAKTTDNLMIKCLLYPLLGCLHRQSVYLIARAKIA